MPRPCLLALDSAVWQPLGPATSHACLHPLKYAFCCVHACCQGQRSVMVSGRGLLLQPVAWCRMPTSCGGLPALRSGQRSHAGAPAALSSSLRAHAWSQACRVAAGCCDASQRTASHKPGPAGRQHAAATAMQLGTNRREQRCRKLNVWGEEGPTSPAHLNSPPTRQEPTTRDGLLSAPFVGLLLLY